MEREARDNRLTRENHNALRAAKASPILADFKKWLDHEAHVALAKSAIGQAIGYALNQWPNLVRYLDDGRLDIDNNAAERELRPIAAGRKNWSFAGSDAGGHRAAVIYSVIASCRRHGVDLYAYIADVLERISTHPANRVSDLCPVAGRRRPGPKRNARGLDFRPSTAAPLTSTWDHRTRKSLDRHRGLSDIASARAGAKRERFTVRLLSR